MKKYMIVRIKSYSNITPSVDLQNLQYDSEDVAQSAAHLLTEGSEENVEFKVVCIL